MTATLVLYIFGAAQSFFLAMLLVFLIARRQSAWSRHTAFTTGRDALILPIRDWIAAEGPVKDVVAGLRALPPSNVVGYASFLVRSIVPSERRAELAELLRGEAWVRRAIANASSRRWWRRIDAARALAIVGTPEDRPTVQRLLEDVHPAVLVAAVACLPLVADAAVVNRVLDRYPLLTPVIRKYLVSKLAELPVHVDPLLAARLGPLEQPEALAEWVRLAGALGLPAALRAAALLTAHESALVRAAVASALRRMPSGAGLHALGILLNDSNASVREEAAASLGALGSAMAVPMLEAAMHDRAWQVRRRAGLALAQLGEPGRAVVISLRADPDPYVASMATLASGLTDGALLELTEN